jgi:hypothetical protein
MDGTGDHHVKRQTKLRKKSHPVLPKKEVKREKKEEKYHVFTQVHNLDLKQ